MAGGDAARVVHVPVVEELGCCLIAAPNRPSASRILNSLDHEEKILRKKTRRFELINKFISLIR